MFLCFVVNKHSFYRVVQAFTKKIRRPTTAVTDGLHPLLDISPKNVLVCKGCSCGTQDMNIGLKNQSFWTTGGENRVTLRSLVFISCRLLTEERTDSHGS